MVFEKGNKLAKKPAIERVDTHIHFTATRAEKARWVKAAQSSEHKKLAAWIRDALNQKLRKEPI